MKPALRNQKGQLIVEAVLMIVALMAVVFATANYFKKNEIVQQLVQGPWQNLAGMMQNGVWGAPGTTAAQHPNQRGRHIVILGTTQ